MNKLNDRFQIKRYIKNTFNRQISIVDCCADSYFWVKADIIKNKVLVSRDFYACRLELKKALIWHEIGHFEIFDLNHSLIKSEVLAFLWVIKTLRKLKYKRLLKETFWMLNEWLRYESRILHCRLYLNAAKIIKRCLNDKDFLLRRYS